MTTGKIAIASDHAGFALKEIVRKELAALGFDVSDLGPADTQSVDYPDFAARLAEWMKTQPVAKGVLICGSGTGMSIAANRHRHVRAALCRSGLEAALARKHNDANVLCLGERLTGVEVAKDCVKQFFTTEFEGGRHQMRVAKMS